MEHLWIAIVLVAAALQTARNAGQKYLGDRLSTLSTTWVRFAFGLPIAGVYCTTLWKVSSPNFALITSGFLIPCFLAALCQLTGTAFLILLFRQRNFAIGSTYVRSEAIIAAIIGALFFEDILNLAGWIAVSISVFGVCLMNAGQLGIGVKNIPRALFNYSAGIGLLCGLSFGVGSFFIREASLSFESPNFFLTAAITLVTLLIIQTVGLGFYIVLREPLQLGRIISLWRPSLFVGATSAIGSIGWFTAMTIHRVSHVKALAQIEFIFALAVSWLVFGERSSRSEVLGMLLVAIGILLLLTFAK